MGDDAALDPAAREVLERFLTTGQVETDLDVEPLGAKVAAVRERLVDTARAGETTNARGATDDFTIVHGARAAAVFTALGLFEHEAGRPFLPAVVVPAGAEMPGEWYFEMLAVAEGFDERVPDARAARRAIWSTQVLAVWQHPW